MSPGIGMPELLVVLVLALVVVGPQQLPVMMRKVGQMMAQARAMAKDFQNSFEEIGRETELSELRREIEALKQSNPVNEIGGELNKAARAAQDDDIRQLKMKQVEKDQAVLEAAKADKLAALEQADADRSTEASDEAGTGEDTPVPQKHADQIKGR